MSQREAHLLREQQARDRKREKDVEKDILCQFFAGDPNNIDENNSCCELDGQNCDNPRRPCQISLLDKDDI